MKRRHQNATATIYRLVIGEITEAKGEGGARARDIRQNRCQCHWRCKRQRAEADDDDDGGDGSGSSSSSSRGHA